MDNLVDMYNLVDMDNLVDMINVSLSDLMFSPVWLKNLATKYLNSLRPRNSPTREKILDRGLNKVVICHVYPNLFIITMY